MERFNTLMLREWMQHRRGWMVLVALPALVMLAVGLSGHMQVQFDGTEPLQGPLPVAAALAAVCTLLTLFLAWGAALLQSPGLARRDVQDRSIEFWLSLPVGHAQSIAATLVAHLLLFPWAAIAFGLTAGLVTSLLVVSSLFGPGAILDVPWHLLLAAGAAAALRAALGVLLATLWLSPLILGTMAASAWLKRWGVPLVAGVLFIGGTVLERVYGMPVVRLSLQALGDGAWRALFAADRVGGAQMLRGEGDVDFVLSKVPAWAAHDAGVALGNLASPTLLAAVAGGAAAFALLVWRRQRGA